MKRLTLHRLASSLHRCQHYINPCRNRHKTGQNCPNTNVKAKTTMFFDFARENTEKTNSFWKLSMEFIALSLLCVNIFFVKALRQWWQNREAMKRWNVNYGKKLKQWSVEALNASSHCFIASSLNRFSCPALVMTCLEKLWFLSFEMF